MNKWETALEEINNQPRDGMNFFHFGHAKLTDYIDIAKVKADSRNIDFCKPEFQANWNLMLELMAKDEINIRNLTQGETMSKLQDAIKEMSKQPKQEQELLTKGVELLKQKFERPKAPKQETGRTL